MPLSLYPKMMRRGVMLRSLDRRIERRVNQRVEHTQFSVMYPETMATMYVRGMSKSSYDHIYSVAFDPKHSLSQLERPFVAGDRLPLDIMVSHRFPMTDIYSGRMVRMAYYRDRTDWVTEFKMVGHLDYTRGGRINATWSGEWNMIDIFQSIVRTQGLVPMPIRSRLPPVAYSPGNTIKDYAGSGTASEVLNDLLSRFEIAGQPHPANWYEHRGAVWIRWPGHNNGNHQTHQIDPSRNLIDSPQVETDGTVSVKVELNPRYILGDEVELLSSGISGTYIIARIAHQGETWLGQWETKLALIKKSSYVRTPTSDMTAIDRLLYGG